MRRPRWFWGHGDRRPRGFKGLVRIRCHGPILEATFFFGFVFAHGIIMIMIPRNTLYNYKRCRRRPHPKLGPFFSSSSWMILPSWSSWCFAFKVDTCQPGAILRIQNALIATCFKNKAKMDFGKLDFLGCLGNGMRNRTDTSPKHGSEEWHSDSNLLGRKSEFSMMLAWLFPAPNDSEGLELNFFGAQTICITLDVAWIMWDYFMMNLCNSFRPQSPPFGFVETY